MYRRAGKSVNSISAPLGMAQPKLSQTVLMLKAAANGSDSGSGDTQVC
jgi:hypothetical protein